MLHHFLSEFASLGGQADKGAGKGSLPTSLSTSVTGTIRDAHLQHRAKPIQHGVLSA